MLLSCVYVCVVSLNTQVMHLPLLPSPVPVRSFLPDPTETVEAPDEGLCLSMLSVAVA